MGRLFTAPSKGPRAAMSNATRWTSSITAMTSWRTISIRHGTISYAAASFSPFQETILGLSDTVNAHKKDAWYVLGRWSGSLFRYVLRTTGRMWRR